MTIRELLRNTVIEERFYLSSRDVRKIVGVNAASLQQWLARDLIPFRTVKAGHRTWRRFHISQLPRLVLVSEILGNGLPISEALNDADQILNWKVDNGTALWGILWLRPNNVIYYVAAGEDLESILDEYDRASCIVLIFNSLIRKIESALAAAKDQHYARDEYDDE